MAKKSTKLQTGVCVCIEGYACQRNFPSSLFSYSFHRFKAQTLISPTSINFADLGYETRRRGDDEIRQELRGEFADLWVMRESEG